jgi:hypothetical protein
MVMRLRRCGVDSVQIRGCEALIYLVEIGLMEQLELGRNGSGSLTLPTVLLPKTLVPCRVY